jgi:uncharacterized protein YbjT (DUF2867 family)
MRMYIILGGTGHVGSATVAALLARGEAVTIFTRDPDRAQRWRAAGAELLEGDVDNVQALRRAFRFGRRALLLNPPADVKDDTDTVERRRVSNILAALEGSGLEKVVAVSTGSAQPGSRLGDLSVLWELEEGLRRQPIPAAINRGAYYMSNWDGLLETVRDTGRLPTLFDAELRMPMVAPGDLGEIAAKRLVSALSDVGVRYVEGPRRYTPADVAKAFEKALDRDVEVAVTPRAEWKASFRRLGFSPAAADAYARMTVASVSGGFDMPDDSVRGGTTLETYIADLAAKAGVGYLSAWPNNTDSRSPNTPQ